MNDAARMLENLRWGPDQIVVNAFDEQVWLASFRSKASRGITECCFTEAPCRYHKALYDGESPVPWVPALELVKHWTGVVAVFPMNNEQRMQSYTHAKLTHPPTGESQPLSEMCKNIVDPKYSADDEAPTCPDCIFIIKARYPKTARRLGLE